MHDTLLKICGITKEDDGLAAYGLGADLIGVVRAPGSPRYASDATIKALHAMNVPLAGVYTHKEDIGPEADYLDYVQLHFKHSADIIKSVKQEHHVRVISVAISTDNEVVHKLSEYHAGGADIILIEFANGFRREMEKAKSLRKNFRFGAAGSIQHEDLPSIRELDLAMIDVSRSLESSPGVKDREKMKSFIEEALN
ncbi:MAG: phosphoribosylanthranilate isomerase [Candidatus Thermoplasmatota archaeon]|nr:phosphoribosylanthranilate isomerase [Candidatus Thermoplasmatota archaeon]